MKSHKREPTARQVTGALGEDLARRYLESKGMRFVAKNFRSIGGEIDLLMVRKGTVHIIEVKSGSDDSRENISRENMDGWRPEDHVSYDKLRKVARTAEAYMVQAGDKREYQIDLVVVFIDRESRRARCIYYPQVLE